MTTGLSLSLFLTKVNTLRMSGIQQPITVTLPLSLSRWHGQLSRKRRTWFCFDSLPFTQYYYLQWLLCEEEAQRLLFHKDKDLQKTNFPKTAPGSWTVESKLCDKKCFKQLADVFRAVWTVKKIRGVDRQASMITHCVLWSPKLLLSAAPVCTIIVEKNKCKKWKNGNNACKQILCYFKTESQTAPLLPITETMAVVIILLFPHL